MLVAADFANERNPLLLRVVAIWETCANRRQNVFAQFHAVTIANGLPSAHGFFPDSDATRKISSFSVSRSQRGEKSRNAPLGKRASALGKTNCLGAVPRVRVRVRGKQPCKFIQHSRRVWHLQRSRGVAATRPTPLPATAEFAAV